ncbi:IS110 family transposase [Ponticaulis profundi]|uniref:IS110 family transposase n=1 Tax=Ponticaulis profundi TaxID=2665222 RepID=A0ABW1SDG8_9PROT|tara:strand:+ start:190 stop:1119 length:930 start_codon:yes stop_codon:yes gene_type:complete
MAENYIGVDVAKDWIDVFDPETGIGRRIRTCDLTAFAKAQSDKLVVAEASGGYERPLIAALEAAGTRYVRVNPRHAREFARATGKLAKTDRTDARTLAAMGAALELKADEPACPARTRLAALNARRDALKAHVKKEKTRLQQTSDAWIRADIKSLLAVLERRVLKVEAEIASEIKANDNLTRLDAQLQTAPGIGKIVSAVLIGKLPELGHANRRQIASLAGLAPHAHDSGYMRGKRRIWGGRKEVKSALYIAAFIASRKDPEMIAERARMQEAGKPFKVVIIALARRLLTRLNSMVKEDRNYRFKPLPC